MDQDGTWRGGRPHPTRLCVRWGPSPSPIPQKGGGIPLPNFRLISIVVSDINIQQIVRVSMVSPKHEAHDRIYGVDALIIIVVSLFVGVS